jgi:hypothetical protein
MSIMGGIPALTIGGVALCALSISSLVFIWVVKPIIDKKF